LAGEDGMTRLLSRQRLGSCADWLAVAVAVALPWSTTLAGVFIALWVGTLIASWDIAQRLREPWRVAGVLPVALWAFAAAGTLWAHVPLADRIDGLNAFHKLLAIPFLAIQFRDCGRGMRVLVGFLLSCIVLLLVSWGLVLFPDLPWRGRLHIVEGLVVGGLGIPTKDYISQGTMFTLCILGLAEGAMLAWRQSRRGWALLLVSVAIVFLANILYVATSRTALVALPLLLMLFAFRRLGWKGAAGMLIVIAVLAAAAWPASGYLRQRVIGLITEVRGYQPSAASTSAGERLEFWRKSLIFIADAPVLGHGTGSIREQFGQSASGQGGMAALPSTNPHNQIFATAIQLGLVGTLLLLAMWIAHLRFFRGAEMAAGIGLLVVVQNIISSLFNSSLFDFTHGWIYVLAVGVLCGMVLHDPAGHRSVASTVRDSRAPESPPMRGSLASLYKRWRLGK
jgi:O-antigen ligase